jgi:alanine-glyoxylate transaminase/serine-glyoxylate transaminase/serine-pyruvate transaminase
MGPGPSPVPVRVLNALAMPTLGHLDPQYVEIMDETVTLLRQVFQTKNRLTFPVSGTGMAGMEALAVNLLEPGDEAIVCVNGVFGTRMKDIVGRCGATAHEVAATWGTIITDAQIAEAVQKHPKAKLVTIVHAETSTGCLQPLEGISKIVHDAGMLLVVDAVTSLGGHPVKVDEWGIDAIFSGTQKCLSCPPGLSPVSFSDRAVEVIEKRKTKPQSWYLDVSAMKSYYFSGPSGGARAYHHTAPINMTYGLREALRIVVEEGLEARFARHQANHLRLRAGLEKMGLKYIPESSLWSLNAIHKPEGVDDAAGRKRLLTEFGIEIGAGLGPFAGKAWRIGLMGHGSTARNVETVLAALKIVLGG